MRSFGFCTQPPVANFQRGSVAEAHDSVRCEVGLHCTGPSFSFPEAGVMLPFRLLRASGRQRLEEEEEEDEERLSKNESPLLWLRLLLTPALERGLSRSPPRLPGAPPLRGRLAEARTGGAA